MHLFAFPFIVNRNLRRASIAIATCSRTNPKPKKWLVAQSAASHLLFLYPNETGDSYINSYINYVVIALAVAIVSRKNFLIKR